MLLCLINMSYETEDTDICLTCNKKRSESELQIEFTECIYYYHVGACVEI